LKSLSYEEIEVKVVDLSQDHDLVKKHDLDAPLEALLYDKNFKFMLSKNSISKISLSINDFTLHRQIIYKVKDKSESFITEKLNCIVLDDDDDHEKNITQSPSKKLKLMSLDPETLCQEKSIKIKVLDLKEYCFKGRNANDRVFVTVY